ncbi:MAG: MBL fold metallo-hydrolase [Herpetosiphonaceae bacterium]|nr:MAG: MBL fold metallo-hydrolase [Herpetosiphonaceae bacterium]
MSDEMVVKFWGVRGSYPVPGASTLRYGGNTPCVELRASGQTIILDAGTGIIGLGSELSRRSKETGKPVVATMLFSHMHHDHTQGFPFFTPAYNGSSILYMFGPSIFERNLKELLDRAMLPPAFPVSLEEMNSLKVMRNICETDVVLLGEKVGGVAVRNIYHESVENDDSLVRIRTLRSYAHPDGVHTYRIEWKGRSVVYATDTEGYVGGDQRLVAFSRGADILIHDAQYTEEHYLGRRPGAPATQGWGHSTAAMACEVAKQAQVKQLILFHHEPLYDDDTIAQIEEAARRAFPNTISAHEGLEIRL